jgi:hypothetical protein
MWDWILLALLLVIGASVGFFVGRGKCTPRAACAFSGAAGFEWEVLTDWRGMCE